MYIMLHLYILYLDIPLQALTYLSHIWVQKLIRVDLRTFEICCPLWLVANYDRSHQFLLGSSSKIKTPKNHGKLTILISSECFNTFPSFPLPAHALCIGVGYAGLTPQPCLLFLFVILSRKNLQKTNYFTSNDPHHGIYTFSYWQIFWHSI